MKLDKNDWILIVGSVAPVVVWFLLKGKDKIK